jgi:hypothetical protein
MKQIILFSFDNLNEGNSFMNTFQYPCIFTVNRNWDVWYDKNGNILTDIPEIKYNNIMLNQPNENIVCITDELNFINDEYCYDGDFIFITRT